MAQPQLMQNRRVAPRFPMSEQAEASNHPDNRSSRLAGKLAIVSGCEGFPGHAAAIRFAREGAEVIAVHTDNDVEADPLGNLTAHVRYPCRTVHADLTQMDACRRIVRLAADTRRRIDILVLGVTGSIATLTFDELSPARLRNQFESTVISAFQLTQAALPHIPDGGTIIFTGMPGVLRHSPQRVACAVTDGALRALAESLAQSLSSRRIRVNLVAPASFRQCSTRAGDDAVLVAANAGGPAMKYDGTPADIGSVYAFLASDGATYVTGRFFESEGG